MIVRWRIDPVCYVGNGNQLVQSREFIGETEHFYLLPKKKRLAKKDWPYASETDALKDLVNREDRAIAACHREIDEHRAVMMVAIDRLRDVGAI